jgi:hypothetical protein
MRAPMGRQISGQFGVAAAEATEGGTDLLAKTSTVFKAALVEGDTTPERPGWQCGWRAPSPL